MVAHTAALRRELAVNIHGGQPGLDTGQRGCFAEIVAEEGVSGTNVESGWLAGNLPFIRLGRGEKRVVILPGLADAAWEVTRHTGDSAEHYRRFADGFTLYVISRQRGLPADYTTREMAADYGRAIREEIGPVIVLGISLGGCIAQHLAADFPELVERLVIACAGYRVSEEGRKIPERWLALAREKRWREFYFDIAKVTLREFHHTFYQFQIGRAHV